MLEIIRRFELINGMPADLWITHKQFIKEFIAKHELKPLIDRKAGISGEIAEESIIDIDTIGGMPGGRRVPHLHYRGEMYMLDPEQWRSFSRVVMEDISKRVMAANQVSFNELLGVAESASSLMR